MPRKKVYRSVVNNNIDGIKERVSVVSEKTKNLFGHTKEKTSVYYKKTSSYIKRHPLGSFFIALGLLFAVLLLSYIFQKAPAEQPKNVSEKTVKVYTIGEAPKATFQAKVEKSGVVKIMAQTSGVVQKISVKEGDTVIKGQQIIFLSTNYQGGNAGSVQRQIAQTQYQNVLDTFQQQKDVVQKQRDVANTTDENSDRMREIQRQSNDETNSLINDNQSMIDQMNQALEVLQASPMTPENTQNILTLQGSINQVQGGLNQLRAAQRTTEYQSSNDNPPAKLSDLQKDIALKQLDIQEKGLDLNKEVSRLQLSLAYINEALMYPASPFAGKIERVNVHEGQLVTPGTVLATVSANEITATIILNVPEKIAGIIIQGNPSEIIINDKKIAVTPYYVSTQATEGQLYSVFYDLPEGYQQYVADGEFITVNVPVNPVKVVETDPFVPVDAIYQSQDQSFLLLVKNGKAETRKVTIGKIYGNYVEVLTGISSGDQIVLDRNVIAGDKVKVE